jgi:predicted transposase/invertase (TIGR01784 family)
MSRFATPYSDTTFKLYFGQESTKDLLRDLLNALLPPENQIAELEITNVEQLPTLEGFKGITFDLHCKGTNDDVFIVEMQRARRSYFIDRSLYYTSTSIRSQLSKGSTSYKLKPVFFIAIMDFKLDDPELRLDAVQEVALKNQHGVVVYPKLRLFYVQLPLFQKSENELSDRRDQWLYTLKNLESLEKVPSPLAADPVFRKFYDNAADAGSSKAVLLAIENELDAARRSYDEFLAKMEDIEAKGRAEGKVEGIAEGKVEGRAEEKLEVARTMKADGLPVATIAKYTALSLAEIEAL